MLLDLYDGDNHHHLTGRECEAFMKGAIEGARPEVRTIRSTLHYTAGTISETLVLTTDRMAMTDRRIIFEAVRKRTKGMYSAPRPKFLDNLDLIQKIRAPQKNGCGQGALLWHCSHSGMEPHKAGSEGGGHHRTTRKAETLAVWIFSQCHSQPRSASQIPGVAQRRRPENHMILFRRDRRAKTAWPSARRNGRRRHG